MKFLSLILCLILVMPCYAGTLVKYDKQTGNIIQTNDNLEKIPSDEILNDRFISDTADVIFVEGSVDIAKQKVDQNEKKLVNIPKSELDARKQAEETSANKKSQDKQKAIDKLKNLGFTGAEIEILTE